MAQSSNPQQSMMQRAMGGIEAFFKPAQEVDSRIARDLGDRGANARQFNQDVERGNTQDRQQRQGNQQQQGNQQRQQVPGSTNEGANNDPESFQNPLDVYKDLFNNTPAKDKDGKEIAPPEPPKFALDPKAINTAADSMDFMSGLPEDVQAKLQSGNIDAATLAAVVNHTGRQAYARAMEHSSTLTDRFVGLRLGHEKQGLNGDVRRILAQNRVLSNPNVANNPALKEHMEMVSDKLARKFPDQTPEWIAEKTQQYFQDLAMAVNPDLGRQQNDPNEGRSVTNPKTGETTKDGKVFDWGGYLKDPA